MTDGFLDTVARSAPVIDSLTARNKHSDYCDECDDCDGDESGECNSPVLSATDSAAETDKLNAISYLSLSRPRCMRGTLLTSGLGLPASRMNK